MTRLAVLEPEKAAGLNVHKFPFREAAPNIASLE
jgi:hypothetical protein